MLSQEDLRRLSRQIYFTHLIYVATASPPFTYLVALTGGLSKGEALGTLTWLLPPLLLLFGVFLPYMGITYVVRWAFEEIPQGSSDTRLSRLLKLPRLSELVLLGYSTVGGTLLSLVSALYNGKSLWRVPWLVSTFVLVFMLVQIHERLGFEKILRPYVLEEFRRDPKTAPAGSGVLWPRQSWYLPYAFGLFVASALLIAVTVIGAQVFEAYVQLRGHLNGGALIDMAALEEGISQMARGSILPIVLLGAFLLINAGLVAWRLAEAQTEGARSVQAAMEALASGSPRLPDWISTDEIGDLAVATARVFDQLKTFSLSLGESAETLKRSAEELGMSTTKQSEVLTLQATALQETQVTAQEIKQTSILASQKAEGVLQQTERADNISQAGNEAIQKSLGGLLEIGNQVRDMAGRIKSLEDRTRQIANITTTVKDLADQSNMLALNAAIEAVRSGEHGKGFGVVAREIRALADQSIKATNGVRDILQDITEAIRTTVAITEQGAEKLEVSLSLVREFGGNIQQLAGIVRENAAAVRQITAAVTQQNAGIGQIFQAVNDLSKIMDQTMAQLRASEDAVALVRSVADKVTSFVGNYSWERMGGGQPGAEAPKLAPGTRSP